MAPPPPDAGSGGAPRRLSLLRRLALVLAPLAALLLLLEGLLWGLGLGQPPSAGLSRGFDPEARYLVRDGDGWRTQIFGDLARAEIVVPPRDDRRRVLLVGGSNVQILPDDHLQWLLNDRAGARRWEVVNLGRQGYGSERVSILLRQALSLKPDVVVIYSGHNEFVERGFQRELEAAWESPWQQRAADLLGNLRLFNLLRSFAAGRPAADVLDVERVPEPIQRTAPGTTKRADPAALKIPWSETLRYWEAYRRNLTAMCRMAQAEGAQVVLCTIVGNQLWPPMVSTLPPELPADDAARVERLLASALASIPERWKQALWPAARVEVRAWYSGTVNAGPDGRPLWQPVLRPLGGPFVHAPATTGESRSPAGAHWPPPEAWDEGALTVLAANERLLARQVPEAERPALVAAGRYLDEALALVPDHPECLFARGLVTWLLAEDDPRAAELFAAAAAFDRAPKSGNDTSNAIVREVAASVPGVRLLDVDRSFRQHTPHGLVGYELVMDNCHLQPGVRFVLMDALAPVLEELVAR